MHVYKLDNKQQDKEFMERRKVLCKAVIPATQPAPPLNAGEAILVILSNGKKYKGKVISFEYFLLNGCHVGEIELIRF